MNHTIFPPGLLVSIGRVCAFVCILYAHLKPSCLGLEQGLLGIIGVLQVQVPIVWRSRLSHQPCLVQRFHHLIGQRPLLKIPEVSLQLLETTNAHPEAVSATVVHVKSSVVPHPAQGRLHEREPVLLHDRLDDAQSLKRCISEIAPAVTGSPLAGVTISPFCGDVVCLVFAGEESTGKRVIDDDVEAVPATSMNELGLDAACLRRARYVLAEGRWKIAIQGLKHANSIVHGLEDGWAHPALLSTQRDNLRHLKGRKVAEAQLDKLALLVQLINGLQGLGKGNRMIRRMEIEDIDLVCIQFLEGQLQLLAQDIWFMAARELRVPFEKTRVRPRCFQLALAVNASCSPPI